MALAALVIGLACLVTKTMAADLTWYTTKQEALDKALLEGKKILFLAGRAA